MTNRFAIVENGVVTNVVIANAETALASGWVVCPTAGPGWKYNGSVFTEPDSVQAPAAPTKEELMAELAALTAKINALG